MPHLKPVLTTACNQHHLFPKVCFCTFGAQGRIVLKRVLPVQAHAPGTLQDIMDRAAASLPADIAQLEAQKKRLNDERKMVAKVIAKEKRKRKNILAKTKALSEQDMIHEIMGRRARAAARGSTTSA